MKTLDVGVDLDGVGYNFQAALAPFARAQGYPLASESRWNEIDPETNTHGGFASWGIPDYAALMELVPRAIEEAGLYARGCPFPGFIEMMRSLSEDGHRIHIITARTSDTESPAAHATRSWLGEWSIPYRTLSFSRNKALRRTDLFIEDSTYNYSALEESGMTVPFLVSRPWNLFFDSSNRVDDPLGFLAEVRKAAGHSPTEVGERGGCAIPFLEPERA